MIKLLFISWYRELVWSFSRAFTLQRLTWVSLFTQSVRSKSHKCLPNSALASLFFYLLSLRLRVSTLIMRLYDGIFKQNMFLLPLLPHPHVPTLTLAPLLTLPVFYVTCPACPLLPQYLLSPLASFPIKLTCNIFCFSTCSFYPKTMRTWKYFIIFLSSFFFYIHENTGMSNFYSFPHYLLLAHPISWQIRAYFDV